MKTLITPKDTAVQGKDEYQREGSRRLHMSREGIITLSLLSRISTRMMFSGREDRSIHKPLPRCHLLLSNTIFVGHKN